MYICTYLLFGQLWSAWVERGQKDKDAPQKA